VTAFGAADNRVIVHATNDREAVVAAHGAVQLNAHICLPGPGMPLKIAEKYLYTLIYVKDRPCARNGSKADRAFPLSLVSPFPGNPDGVLQLD